MMFFFSRIRGGFDFNRRNGRGRRRRFNGRMIHANKIHHLARECHKSLMQSLWRGRRRHRRTEQPFVAGIN